MTDINYTTLSGWGEATGGGKTVKAIKNRYTEQGTHILKISGHGMEPIFDDGDEIIVREVRGEKPPNGRDGLFLVNGKLWLRQFLEGRLHPYNPAYEDIIPGEDDRVDYVGYVVGILDDSWVLDKTS